MNSRRGLIGLGGLFFLSLALLNLRSDHGWGDDFAMYIRQAMNIVEGIPQDRNGYIYIPEISYYAPQSYPIGLPLLLAPIYAVFGNSIFHFEWVMAALAFLYSLLIWIYLSRETKNDWIAFAFTIPIAMNPWMVDFKGNILSDLPFACVTLAVVLLLSRAGPVNVRMAIAVGTIAGYALLVRSAALTIFAAVFAHLLFSLRKGPRRDLLLGYGALLGSGLGLFLLFQYVLFPATTLSTYVNSVSLSSLVREISKNANYYVGTIREFIPNAGPVIFQTILYHFVVVGVFVGFFIQARKRLGYREWFVLAYLGLLVTWPGLQGFRLLLPLAPLGLGYLLVALHAARLEIFQGRRSKYLAAGVFAVTFLVFFHPVRGVQKTVKSGIDGPQSTEASEAFAYIAKTLPENSVTAFRKARAFALYTGRSSIVDPSGNGEAVADYLGRHGATHILVDRKWSEAGVQEAARSHGKSVWKNERFELFAYSRRSTK